MRIDKTKLKSTNLELQNEAGRLKKLMPAAFTLQQAIGVFGPNQKDTVDKFEILLEFGFITINSSTSPQEYQISTNLKSRKRMLDENQKVFKRQMDEAKSRTEMSKEIASLLFHLEIMR